MTGKATLGMVYMGALSGEGEKVQHTSGYLACNLEHSKMANVK